MIIVEYRRFRSTGEVVFVPARQPAADVDAAAKDAAAEPLANE